MTATIADRGPEFEADHALRHMPLTLVRGLPALKADAEESDQRHYAWPGPGEMTPREIGGTKHLTIFEAKIKASRLDNVWLGTLSATAAVPFVNRPVLERWPASIQPGEDGSGGFPQSVDSQGRSLHAYWADAFFHKLVSGIDYTLIDMPAELGSGLAYWVPIRAGQVLEVVTSLEAGQQRAMEARISWNPSVEQSIRTDPAEWPKRKRREIVRVYRVSEWLSPGVDPLEPGDTGAIGVPGGPVRFRESAKVDTGEGVKWAWLGPWHAVMPKGGGVFTEIPLVPHYANQVAPFRGQPPFLDTASLQMSYWRKMIDYDERERRDALNVAAISGAKKPDVDHDGRMYWLPKGAELHMAETTGDALAALRASLDAIRAQIAAGNLRPLLAQPQVTKTATEIITGTVSANSMIEMWILLDIASFTRALQMTAELNDEDPSNGKLFMPHDVGLSPGAFELLWDGYIKSKGQLVPAELIWSEAKRHQTIGEGVDAAEVAAQVSEALSAAPGRSGVPSNPASD